MKKILLRTLISAAFLGLLFWLIRGDIPAIAQTLKNIDGGLLAVSIAISLFSVIILARRFQLIFAAEGISIKLTECSNLTFVGYFFNNFLPTSVGGDIVKAMCAARITQHPVKAVTTVLMDRIFGLFTFIMIPSISLLFFLKRIQNPLVPIITYSLLVVSIFCFVLIFNRKAARKFKFVEHFLNWFHLGEKVRKIYDGLHNFKNHQGVVVQAMALSLAGQTINIFVLYVMALALGAHTSVIYFYLLVPVVHLISMLPSLNGLGIREGAYVYFLTPVIGRETSAALGILWLGMLLLLSIIGGIIYLVRHDYHVQFGIKEVAG